MAQRRNYTNRSLKSRLQSVHGVVGGAYERIYNLVVLKDSHEGSVAYRIHKVLRHVARSEQAYGFAVFQLCGKSQVGVFSASRNPFKRLCHKRDIEAVHGEYISHHVLDLILVVGRLHGVCIFPVYFQLLHNVVVVACSAHFGLYASDLLMSHFHAEAVLFQKGKGVLKSRSHLSVGSLPVLLLQNLSGEELFSVAFVVGSLYPEFQLCCAGYDYFIYVVCAVDSVYVLKSVRMSLESL